MRERLSSVVSRAQSEEGCLEFRLHENADDPGTFVLYEVWRTERDARRHLEQPAMQDFMAHRMEYLVTDVDVHRLVVDSGTPFGGALCIS